MPQDLIGRVYLHYPFCLTMCRYCSFVAGVAPKEDFINSYHHSLLKEIKHYQDILDFSKITQNSLYLGGGTPSLMPMNHMEELFQQFDFSTHSEITLEINPETVTKEKARFWKSLGINRVSLGWQSMNQHTLSFLGRSGTNHDNIQAFEILRNEGFDNISIDRILSVANDTDDDFFDAIKQHTPDHISTYQLSIDNKTVLNYWTQIKKYIPVTDKKALVIEQNTENILNKLGFERYETSNYHRNGKTGKHNLGYWNYEYWLGLGAGASGFIPNNNFGLRYQNKSSFKEYLLTPSEYQDSEDINKKTAIKESLMLGIRKREGILKQQLEERVQISWNDLFSIPCSTEFFIETEESLILKHSMIPYTNPAILWLWNHMNSI